MATPTSSEIQKALDGIPAGTKVKVKLEDGSERSGTIGGVDGDAVEFDGAQVDADQIADIVIEGSDPGNLVAGDHDLLIE